MCVQLMKPQNSITDVFIRFRCLNLSLFQIENVYQKKTISLP